MKLYGLGIDCSGFVYNVLAYAFSKNNSELRIDNILDWEDKNKVGVYRAGAFVFAGKASTAVKPEQLKELDLILI